jgi:hypothetical protein
MSVAMRTLYVLGSPLIPWVRLARMLRAARTPALRAHLVRCLPALLVGLWLDGAGQMVGYALGSGNAADRLAQFEFRRIDHVTARDREEVFVE